MQFGELIETCLSNNNTIFLSKTLPIILIIMKVIDGVRLGDAISNRILKRRLKISAPDYTAIPNPEGLHVYRKLLSRGKGATPTGSNIDGVEYRWVRPISINIRPLRGHISLQTLQTPTGFQR
jgi:hypothetical protein